MAGKTNRKGRSKVPPFVMIELRILRCEAFQSLRATAQALYLQICQLYNGSNNGELFLSQRTAAARLNIKNHATVAKYFTELIEAGFIRVATKGSFDNKTKLSTKWILTHLPHRERKATRDYEKVSKRIRDARALSESRSEKLNRADAIIVPPLPEGWPDGGDFQAHFERDDCVDGDDNHAVYNIPPEVVSGLARNGVSNALN